MKMDVLESSPKKAKRVARRNEHLQCAHGVVSPLGVEPVKLLLSLTRLPSETSTPSLDGFAGSQQAETDYRCAATTITAAE